MFLETFAWGGSYLMGHPALYLVIYISGRVVRPNVVLLKASLKGAWFLAGSIWFQACLFLRKPLFFLSKTLRGGLVPAWFHLVPTVVQQRKPLFSLAKP